MDEGSISLSDSNLEEGFSMSLVGAAMLLRESISLRDYLRDMELRRRVLSMGTSDILKCIILFQNTHI